MRFHFAVNREHNDWMEGREREFLLLLIVSLFMMAFDWLAQNTT